MLHHPIVFVIKSTLLQISVTLRTKKKKSIAVKSFFQVTKIIHITNDILNPQEQNVNSRMESARSTQS